MKILILGAGVVGTTTGDGLERYGHRVVFYDVDDSKLKTLESSGFNVSDRLTNADVIMVCTPEENVENVVDKIITENIEGLIVIRSTVLPGTTKQLATKSLRHICHNPEFLTAGRALWDFMNPYKIVIGECCKGHGDALEELYRPFRVPIIRVDPTTSEMIKIATNAYFSTLISFWNEMSNICKKIGVNSQVVGKSACLDARVSNYGAAMHGRKFAGRCLPKDLDQLIEFCEKFGYNPELLKAVKATNERMKR